MPSSERLKLIHNGTLVDGNGASPIADGLVVVRGERIVYAGAASGFTEALPAEVEKIDARGGTIMPGLVEAHFHATYFNVERLEDLDIKYPVEFVTLQAAVNCQLALECGYTAARSGGCLFNCDVCLEIITNNAPIFQGAVTVNDRVALLPPVTWGVVVPGF